MLESIFKNCFICDGYKILTMNNKKIIHKKIGLLLIGLILGALAFYVIYPFIDGIIYGIFIYYITRPIYNFLKKKIKSKYMSKYVIAMLSVSIVLLLIITPFFFAISYVAAVIYRNLHDLIEKIEIIMPQDYIDDINSLVEALATFNFENLDILLKIFAERSDVYSVILQIVSMITNNIARALFMIFIAIIVAFYLLADLEKIENYLSSILESRDYRIVKRFSERLDRYLNDIFVGVFTTMIITAIMCFISLSFLNTIAPEQFKISSAVIISLSVIAGLANILPGIGIKIVWIPMALIFLFNAYFTGNLLYSLPYIFLFSFTMAFVVDFVPDQIIRPYICGREIHSGIILLSFIGGVAVFGAYGIFLGPIIIALFFSYIKEAIPEIINEKKIKL